MARSQPQSSQATGTFEDNEPRFRHEKWREVFDKQLKSTPLTLIVAADPLFSLPLGEYEEKFETWLTKERVWDRYSTLSQIAMLDGEKLEVSVLVVHGCSIDLL